MAKWTAAAVVDALRVAYGVAGSQLVTDEWAFLTEVPLRAPGRSGALDRWSGNERTIDVLLTRAWTSKPGHRRIAVEVKISRSDYRNETAVKRAPAELAAHQTFYAAPAGLIVPTSLPEGWGLLECYADRASYEAGKGWDVGAWPHPALVKCRTRAVERTPACDLDYLVAAGMRRASRAEERIRRGADEAAQAVALKAEVERLRGQLERRDAALDRERLTAKALRSLALAVEGGHECADCGQPITLAGRGVTWKHTDKAHEVACHAQRAEADRKAREARFGTSYAWGTAGPVWPKALAEHTDDDGDYHNRLFGVS